MKNEKIEQIRNNVRQAVARGWCHPETEKKIMDVILAEAITIEVVKILLPKVEFLTA